MKGGIRKALKREYLNRGGGGGKRKVSWLQGGQEKRK
jgi:hypothetical protein